MLYLDGVVVAVGGRGRGKAGSKGAARYGDGRRGSLRGTPRGGARLCSLEAPLPLVMERLRTAGRVRAHRLRRAREPSSDAVPDGDGAPTQDVDVGIKDGF
jgi:hypothetical protein